MGQRRTIKEVKARFREKHLGKTCGKGPNDRYRKMRYPNLYVAMKACEEIRQKGIRRDGQPNVNPIHVYHCECCGGIHIGHLASGESILMYEGVSVNIREAQTCPPSAS